MSMTEFTGATVFPLLADGTASPAAAGFFEADRFERIGSLSSVEMAPSDAIVRHGASWHGMAAETVSVTQHGRVESRFKGPFHLLGLFESGARTEGETSVEGLPGSALRHYQGKLIFAPAGHRYADWQETRSLPRLAYFYFDPAALPVDADLGVAPLAPRLFFENTALWDTAIKLKALIENPRESDRLYCEALGLVLAHELVRLASGGRRVNRRIRGGLASWQQRAAAEYIEEHVAEQISLATLAQLVRLSPYHFSRAFKQSFGVPPHRFHAHRRVERAKDMLAKPAISVTEIGMAIGFGGTGSFTTSFRKFTGMTPTEYRRSVA